FAAGVALRQLVQAQTDTPEETRRAVQQAVVAPDDDLADSVAVDAKAAPAFMAQAVLGFNEQLERIGEVLVVVTIGTLLWAVPWDQASWWLVLLLLLVIRPLAVVVGLAGSGAARPRMWLMGWFGIRGIGSLYYLMYAINHGLPPDLAAQLVGLAMAVVVSSIVLHGVSVTPLMAVYERRVARRR
ncbi:MAG TPA: sodium:proton antiporter, partial [Ramlibacter sp.]|nr:sodium:proton antiporter [Ramlibacter sp.]